MPLQNRDLTISFATIGIYKPELTEKLLRNNLIIQTIKENSDVWIFQAILYFSCNKQAADYVFNNEQIFGTYSNEYKEIIYNKISVNYRKTLPNSFQNQSLFALANDKSIEICLLPENLGLSLNYEKI